MSESSDKSDSTVFPKGERAPVQNFTGTVWVHMLVPAAQDSNYSVGNVTFEPGARSNWHTHPAGQILLVTQGQGLYQEKGQAIRMIKQGETIVCAADIEHWHGASPTMQMSHIAITNSRDGIGVTWLKPVTDEEYGG
ncbi:MAG: cupin domain-containing protein [Pyrinomonadaceae bacterium]